ncbi:MAG: TolC family protein [Lewinellaceae bacterium]|nr:TolC family protein [Lewinellaceae bacterium]
MNIFRNDMAKKLTLTLSLLCLYLGMSGQETWGLQKCIDYAMEHNLQIKSGELNSDLAQINLKQAKHSLFPSLSASVNTGWNFGRTIDPTTNVFNTQTFFNNGYGLNSSLVLFNSGALRNTIKKSQMDSEVSGLNLKQITRDLSINIASLYLTAVYAIENEKIAKTQLDNSKAQREKLIKSIDAGLKSKNEIYNLDAQVALDNQKLVTAVNSVSSAMLSLKLAMRLDSNTEMQLEIPQGIELLTDAQRLSLDELYDTATKNQPSLLAARKRVESAQINENIANSQRLPKLYFGANLNTNYSNKGLTVTGVDEQRIYQDIYINGQQVSIGQDVDIPIYEKQKYFDQLNQNLSYGFGFQMSIPIYENYQNQASIDRARIQTKAELNQLNIEQDNFKSTLMQSLNDAKNAKFSLDAAQSNYEMSFSAYENAKKSYDLGAINNYELLNLQSQMNIAQNNLLTAKYDYIFKLKVLDFYLGKPIVLNQ